MTGRKTGRVGDWGGPRADRLWLVIVEERFASKGPRIRNRWFKHLSQLRFVGVAALTRHPTVLCFQDTLDTRYRDARRRSRDRWHGGTAVGGNLDLLEDPLANGAEVARPGLRLIMASR